MKYFYKILLGLVVLLLVQTPALAKDNITDWYVKDLQTEIVVNPDSSLTITENILADCGNLPDKHGIFRVLPKKYKTVDGTFNLPIKLLSITDKDGNKLNYSTSQDIDTVTYKIGRSSIFVHGENFYQIKYQVKNAIRTGNQNFDELYWNVLGSYWNLEIDNFSAKIIFPTGITKDNSQVSYYTGTINSKDSNLAVYDWDSENTLSVQSNQVLFSGQGITVSVAFPKNIIKPYQASFEDKYGFSLFSLLLFLLFPLITFILYFYFKQKNKDRFNSKKTIVPEFEIPNNLTPIEMGGLMKKGGLDKNSIAATIVHLGVLGYLKIEKTEKKGLLFSSSDFKLINTNKPVEDNLNELEAYILSIILGTTKEVELENISLTISSHFTSLCQKILKQLTDKNLIDGKFKKQKNGIIAVVIVGFMILTFVLSMFSLAIVLGLYLSMAIAVAFIYSLSIFTPEGMKLNNRIKGFQLYMETAEKYRSQFQEQNNILDKLLSYAILFGITKAWLNKLKDIYGEEYMNSYSPSFLSGSYGLIGFSGLVDTIDNVSNHISNGVASAISENTSSSSSGFGGGGGSGGGGGGGGGGGW